MSGTKASVRVTFRGQKEQVAHFYNAGPNVISAMLKKLPDFQQALVEEARQNTNPLSGKLAASISATNRVSDNKVIVLLQSQGVPYAQAQEKGATYAPREILPATGKALAWSGGFAGAGEMNFAAKVQWPGATIPAKHYMLRALQTFRGQFRDLCLQSMLEAMSVDQT